jgi:hypothetical protein
VSFSEVRSDTKNMQPFDLLIGGNLLTPQKIDRAAFLILRPCVRIALGAF